MSESILKTVIACIFFLSSYGIVIAQQQKQVLSSSGTTFSNTYGQIDFTTGELAIASFSNNVSLNQGFHQDYFIVTGISKNDFASNISVYPIPFDINIKIEKTSELQMPATAIVYNNKGQVMSKIDITQRLTQWDASELSSGVYIIKIFNKNFSKTFKAIKK